MSVVASLDDLMEVGEQEPEPQPGRRLGGGWRWVVNTVLLAGTGTLAGALLLRITVEKSAPYVLIFVGLVALRILLAVLAWVRNPLLPDTLRFRVASSQRVEESDLRDGLAIATQRWHRNLAWFGLQGGADGEQFARTLQPRLARLVEERLRLRHGIDLRSNPQRARELLGEPLWALVTTRAKRCPSGRELAALVKQMEAI